MRFIIFAITGILIILAIIFVMRLPHKQGIENLVMPGPVSTAHLPYENQCAQCHSAFDKESQDDLCLNCHKDVAEDIKARQGFHGRFDAVRQKQCRECHTEHQGREFAIVHLEMETFDHDLTDFSLTGAHAHSRGRCDVCHAAHKKFRETPRDCFSCHTDDDPHGGRMGTDCGRCHNETSWKENVYFDHGQTRFSLEGKHKDVACDACHVNQTYAGAPTACVACHLIDDIHDSPREEQCDRCHTTRGWKGFSFDHDKETKFILQDRHAGLQCDLCHPANVFKNYPGSRCMDCHNLDDPHKGKNGNSCEDCHTVAGWSQVSFDHARDTRFKLLGRHAGIPCDACHRANIKEEKLETSCSGCHRADDVHNGQQGTACDSCHNENGWRDNIKFDHDLTNFPLIGVHAVTSCGECHLSAAFKDADLTCLSCHDQDDRHQRTLGTDCARCHNPNGWGLWEFDHSTQTDYKLRGAHEGLECQACHRNPMGKTVQISGTCFSCHEEDDVHSGRYGQQCDQCHTEESFKRIIIKR